MNLNIIFYFDNNLYLYFSILNKLSYLSCHLLSFNHLSQHYGLSHIYLDSSLVFIQNQFQVYIFLHLNTQIIFLREVYQCSVRYQELNYLAKTLLIQHLKSNFQGSYLALMFQWGLRENLFMAILLWHRMRSIYI